MIKFKMEGHELIHEVQTVSQIFYPNMHYQQVGEIEEQGIIIESILKENSSYGAVYENGKLLSEASVFVPEAFINLREKKRIIREPIFEALKNVTGYLPPWGMLTGIRPAKIINELLDEGIKEEEALLYLEKNYFVTDKKALLALDVAKAERNILSSNNEHTLSLYIGIPFCPTRCMYCSFTSYPLSRYKGIVDDYLDALLKELKFLKEKALGYQIHTLYIGGGTPTSLSEEQLERLLAEIKNLFPLEKLSEFTVEAGRPDTITAMKLEILKKYGVSRISINPQTMNQKTLDAVGRRHTVEDIKEVFGIARALGHNDINMDLILGLPGETSADVEHTMKEIELMRPESVTVHTLAVKRASRLKEEFENYKPVSAEQMEKMLEIADVYCKKMGLRPYYMYRQKNMVGSFENVGYCKKGHEGIYNIQIMEEKQTILAAGAGATTKTVDYATNRIERVFNVKSVEDYISRIDEMIQRKEDGLSLYHSKTNNCS